MNANFQFKVKDYLALSVPVDFRLPWGKMGYSRHIFLTLESKSGKTGIGEGVLYKTTHLKLLPFVEKSFPLDVEKLVFFEPALAFAVDTAIMDIKGELINPDWDYPVVREIFLEDENLKSHVTKIRSQGTKTVKLKVGAGLEKDKETISKINSYSNFRLKINLDANRSYNFDDALALARWGKDNNVVLFEEPIAGDFALLRKFKAQSGMAVMLDESIQNLESLDKAIAAKCFDVLNVKLTRLGGISLSLKYIQKCQKSGVKVYLGCSEELETGTKAVFTLAQAVKSLYGIEGFGKERIDRRKGFSYSPGKDNKLAFLTKEFLGIWKTRAENVYLKFIPS